MVFIGGFSMFKAKSTLFKIQPEKISYSLQTEEILRELPQHLLLLLTDWMHKSQQPEQFIALQMDWQALHSTYLSYKFKSTKKTAATPTPELIQFFETTDFMTIYQEIITYYNTSPYDLIDKQIAFVPALQWRGNQLLIEEQQTLSVQAFLLMRAIEFEMLDTLKSPPFEYYMETHEEFDLFSVQQATLENTFLLSAVQKSSATTGLLLYVIYARQLYRLLTDKYETEDHFTKVAELHMLTEKNMYSRQYQKFMTQKIATLERNVKAIKAKYDSAVTKLDKQKELTQKLRDQLKEQKQQPAQPTATQKNNAEVAALEKQLKDMQQELKKAKQHHDLLLKAEQREVRKKDSEITELKAERTKLKEQLNDQKQQLQQAINTELTIEQWLALGKDLLNSTTVEQEHQVKEFLELFLSITEERRANERPQASTHDLFGYYEAREDGHYIGFLNGEVHRIAKLPTNIYLRDSQFVRVNAQYEFIQSYYDCYQPEYTTAIAHQFSTVTLHNDIPHIYAQGQLVPLRLKEGEKALEGQVIAYSRNHELVRYYLSQISHLNHYEKSIRLKGHALYFVQQIVGTGAVVIEPFTQQTTYMELPAHHNLAIYDTFTFADGDIIHTFKHHAFYEQSDYYQQRQSAIVKRVGTQCFVEKHNDEIVILHAIPDFYTPQIGDAIYIDEYHRFVQLLQIEDNLDETMEQKLARTSLYNPKKEKSVFSTQCDDEKTAITVVTSKSYFKNYENNLEPYFDLQLVDAFESEEKIMQATRKAELIVLCTNYLKHPIRNKIKDNYPKEKVFEDHSVGAKELALKLRQHLA